MFLLSADYLGDVAKWQGKGLQNPHQGFKSPRRLFLFKGNNYLEQTLLRPVALALYNSSSAATTISSQFRP